VDPHLFAADLAAKAEHLLALADTLHADADVWRSLPEPSRVIFVGMGSSHYAAAVAAARLRAGGFDAVAEIASSDLLPEPRPGDVVIAISAGGSSRETAAAIEHYRGRVPLALLTNTADTELARSVDVVIQMHAGFEAGGVACRSYLHTLILLMALEDKLIGLGRNLPDLVRKAALATQDLTVRQAEWLPVVREMLNGPDGAHVVAPARRISSAQQSALMLRECPRRVAIACETGDWSHVDVYLTKTTDYRLLLLAGSRWEPELLQWVRERGSTLVAVGAEVPDAKYSLRYAGDDDDDVRLLAEVTVCELLAADLWLSQ
jgi:glucosamine--fructose-6-phosphate aminotransferase (isomerizing)